ncbi:MAG TPA: hypothetical protein VFG76_04175, partial [Candidatus Polarisedimenticolia bacterium]|nr:hypothetical protein [Candidatus Polarisedimenticolia bacterium]
MTPRTESLISTLALAASAAMFLAVTTLYYGHGFFDDSLIGLRYVKNLVEGHGLAWNPGEAPVEGFSSLGWILLLAAFRVSSSEGLERLSIGVGVATGLAVILAAWLVTRSLLPRHLRSVALIVPLHLALSGLLTRHAISGMETMLATLAPILVASLWAFPHLARRRRYWAAIAVL